MNTQELFEQINTLYETFKEEHNGKSKAAHGRARKSLGEITKRYGNLTGDWQEMIRKGFEECFRVLKPNGTLIFKWNEVQFPIKDILKLTEHKPLFGHKSGKRMQTHWVTFIK